MVFCAAIYSYIGLLSSREQDIRDQKGRVSPISKPPPSPIAHTTPNIVSSTPYQIILVPIEGGYCGYSGLLIERLEDPKPLSTPPPIGDHS